MKNPFDWFKTNQKSPWSPSLQKQIDELTKKGEALKESLESFSLTVSVKCSNCRFYDILKDPNHPDITNLCLSDEVLKLKMQPEPHPDFGCKFFQSKSNEVKNESV